MMQDKNSSPLPGKVKDHLLAIRSEFKPGVLYLDLLRSEKSRSESEEEAVDESSTREFLALDCDFRAEAAR